MTVNYNSLLCCIYWMDEHNQFCCCYISRLRKWMAGSQRPGSGSARAGTTPSPCASSPSLAVNVPVPRSHVRHARDLCSRSDRQARTVDPGSRLFLRGLGSRFHHLRVRGAICYPPSTF
jgi:hypothetical protein